MAPARRLPHAMRCVVAAGAPERHQLPLPDKGAGALHRFELAAILAEHLGKTDRGLRLTLPQTKGPRPTP